MTFKNGSRSSKSNQLFILHVHCFVRMHCSIQEISYTNPIDFELKKRLAPPPLGNFADISYLEENFKPHLLRDVCTLCSGALVSDSLLRMLL